MGKQAAQKIRRLAHAVMLVPIGPLGHGIAVHLLPHPVEQDLNLIYEWRKAPMLSAYSPVSSTRNIAEN